MNREERIEEHVRQTLDAFEQAEKLPPNPYFFTRVQARLKRKEKSFTIAHVVKPAVIALLLILNMITVFRYFNRAEVRNDAVTTREVLNLLSEDLCLDETESTIDLIKLR